MTDSKKALFAAMVEAQCESEACESEACERPTHEDYTLCKECLRWAEAQDYGAEERRAEQRFFGGADHARGYWDDYEPYEIY